MHAASSSTRAESICSRIVTVLVGETVQCSKHVGKRIESGFSLAWTIVKKKKRDRMQRDQICIEHMLCHTTVCHQRCVLISSIFHLFCFFVLHSLLLSFFFLLLSFFFFILPSPSILLILFATFSIFFFFFFFLLNLSSYFLFPSCFAHPSRGALCSIPKVSKSGGDMSVHSVGAEISCFLQQFSARRSPSGQGYTFCS